MPRHTTPAKPAGLASVPLGCLIRAVSTRRLLFCVDGSHLTKQRLIRDRLSDAASGL